MNPFVTLSIAGFDPTGGAGIVADIKTFTALGCYAIAAITANTAQNTQGVYGVAVVEASFLEKQLLLLDLPISAVKIGMLANTEIVTVIADYLKNSTTQNLVVDTPIYSSSGYRLLDQAAITILQQRIFPLATLITPNIPETTLLTGIEISSLVLMKEAARRLKSTGVEAVLVKGGHMETQSKSMDLLYDGRDFVLFETERLESRDVHGTGCTLSSAIAAFLAKGLPLLQAVKEAKSYISRAIACQIDLGQGAPLIDHFAATSVNRRIKITERVLHD
ncbi:MAG: bifunctional hydroxymethylpyrimidine kinase/phosphomethylpyrimidine kinase [Blastocatellia bacterium]|nr:bifunctional hydroxymethylpyrimidine kinase/phosphomethylpyrimidine kinase [Blastocatellia bacterium]